jgi:hypothetical protein
VYIYTVIVGERKDAVNEVGEGEVEGGIGADGEAGFSCRHLNAHVLAVDGH